ncbi:hypothetical protein BRADI_1g45196v3 [Brachypodium distachyon]|uniref:Uncharacterized protein n=1 Tax=Brachypodium distachyon TaxID=15368 RepID=A0A2K2DPF7_BRADI|nr:hypothetical protein BRADI_1g45196v3 [Brachypodium distachyon]
MASGSYSAASSYKAQLYGSFGCPTIWDDILLGRNKKDKRDLSGRLVYTWWGIWKERNRRILKGAAMTALQVAHFIWENFRGRGGSCLFPFIGESQD